MLSKQESKFYRDRKDVNRSYMHSHFEFPEAPATAGADFKQQAVEWLQYLGFAELNQNIDKAVLAQLVGGFDVQCVEQVLPKSKGKKLADLSARFFQDVQEALC